jgi:hypothetical protein
MENRRRSTRRGGKRKWRRVPQTVLRTRDPVCSTVRQAFAMTAIALRRDRKDRPGRLFAVDGRIGLAVTSGTARAEPRFPTVDVFRVLPSPASGGGGLLTTPPRTP